MTSAIVGTVITAWLLWDIRREYTRQRPKVRIDHDWMISREREERLKAAAIWRGYKR